MRDVTARRPLAPVTPISNEAANADAGSTARKGLWFLLVAFGGFLLWAFVAPWTRAWSGKAPWWWPENARQCSRWLAVLSRRSS